MGEKEGWTAELIKVLEMLAEWRTTNTCITVCLLIHLTSTTIIVFINLLLTKGNIYFCTYLHTYLRLPWYLRKCCLLPQTVFQQLWCTIISENISPTPPRCMFNTTKGYSIFEASMELPIFLISQSVISVCCILSVGLFLTSACLVGSFALG